MDSKDFSEYIIADISEEDLTDISRLEQTLCSKTNKEVVLIAYQHKEKAES